jgi:poly(3-hydroxybutyrate) depolymerase
MRVFSAAISFVSALVFVGSALAATIDDTPGMRTAGSRTFHATPGTPGATINWTVDRITRSESNGGGEAITRNVYTATGPSATFNLKKVSNKQTIWRIRATDSSGSDTQEVQVFPANKLSSFTYASTGNPVMRVYVVVPSGMNADRKLLFVLHGQSRNVEDYCNYWRNWTADRKVLLLCPYFSDSAWDGGRGYNRGNVFANDSNTRLNPESKWGYTVLEGIHKHARKGFAIDDEYFDIWGFSAGGQFIQRFLFHKPNAKVRLAMPASPGWYMMPTMTTDYACGLRHSQLGFTQADVARYTQLNAVLFIGTRDTDPNDPETGGCEDRQGRGRLARARYFIDGVRDADPETTWQYFEMSGIDHDGERGAQFAQDWLDDQGY